MRLATEILAPAALTALATLSTAQTPTFDPTAELAPPGLFDHDGIAVDLDGDRAAIGATDLVLVPFVVDTPSRVHVWERGAAGEWRIDQVLNPSPELRSFGEALALDGDRLLVRGQVLETIGATDGGRVQLFEDTPTDGWSLVDTWEGDLPSISVFGSDVDLDGDRAIVGSPFEFVPMGPAHGAVYIRERQPDGSWPVVFKHTGGPGPQADIGSAVRIAGDLAVTANPSSDEVLVFERDSAGSWSLAQVLPMPLMPIARIAIGDGRFAVSSFSTASLPNGIVRIFEADGSGTWSEAATIGPPDKPALDADDDFGNDVALAGDDLFVFGTARSGPAGDAQSGLRTWRHSRAADGSWPLTAIFAAPLTEAQLEGRGLALDGDTLLASHRSEPGGNPVLEFRTSDFLSTTDSISLAAGGTQRMDLRPGLDNAHEVFLVLGSFAGTSPGVEIAPGLSLPLVPDPWLANLLANPNGPIENSLGFLDADGRATASLAVPMATDPALAGTTVWHAFVALDPNDPSRATVSQPLALALTP